MVDALDSTMMALERDRTVKDIKTATTGDKSPIPAALKSKYIESII